MNTIILGNCLDKLKDIPDNSIDSIVTDPPYHLVSIVKRFGKEGSAPAQFGTDGAFSRASKGFMGKTWDGLDENGNGIAHNVDMWKECLRVLKPGGHLLSFGGTRTYHRMACAIEDAGFEVRDMVSWIYGSGFPKSLNIGKAVDKLQGNKGLVKENDIEFIKWLRKGLGDHKIAEIDEILGTKAQAFHYFALSNSNRQIPSGESYKKIKEFLRLGDEYDNYVKDKNLELSEIRDIVGYEKAIKTWNKPYIKPTLGGAVFDEAKEWEGWGTALKPACEPCVLARKPLSEKTVAENVLKWGTGGINIDGSRVGTEELTYQKVSSMGATGTFSGQGATRENGGLVVTGEQTVTGRFPANLIHDGSDEVLELFPNSKGASSQNNFSNGKIYRGQSLLESESKLEGYREWYNDNGSAARFFYCAKTSKAERNRGLDSTAIVLINFSICENNTTQEEKEAQLLVDMGILAPKDTEEYGTQAKEGSEWNTLLFGKSLMEKYQEDIKSTILTKTNSTTTLAIYNWLALLLTKEYTADVNLEMENGGSLAEDVENYNILATITNEKMVLALGAKNAQSKVQLKISVKEGKSSHPTVKPQALMKYLIKLITPPGGTVLDPFAGSGSTLLAAKDLGHNYIGIEMTEEYIPIIKARLGI